LQKRFYTVSLRQKEASAIAALVSEDVDWLVPGNTQRVPWVGRKRGRAGGAEFYAQLRAEWVPEHFEIKAIRVKGMRLVAIGAYITREKNAETY